MPEGRYVGDGVYAQVTGGRGSMLKVYTSDGVAVTNVAHFELGDREADADA